MSSSSGQKTPYRTKKMKKWSGSSLRKKNIDLTMAEQLALSDPMKAFYFLWLCIFRKYDNIFQADISCRKNLEHSPYYEQVRYCGNRPMQWCFYKIQEKAFMEEQFQLPLCKFLLINITRYCFEHGKSFQDASNLLFLLLITAVYSTRVSQRLIAHAPPGNTLEIYHEIFQIKQFRFLSLNPQMAVAMATLAWGSTKMYLDIIRAGHKYRYWVIFILDILFPSDIATLILEY